MGPHGPFLTQAKPRNVALALGFATALVASRSRAEPAPPAEVVRLSFVRGDGADGCFSEDELEARVKERLGRDPFASRAAKSIEAVVTRSDQGFVARLFVRANGATMGAREIASRDAECRALEAAVTLAVALAIDPEAAMRAPPPTVAPVAPPIPSVVPERHDPPVVAPPPTDAPPPTLVSAPRVASDRPSSIAGWHVAVAPAFGAAIGLVPGVAPFASLATELRRGWLSARLTGLWIPEQKTADGVAAFGLAAGFVDACAEPARGSFVALGLCAGIGGGAVHAVPLTDRPTQPGERGFFAFDGAARLELAIAPPIVATVTLGAIVPAAHYRFLVEGLGPVYEQSPVAGSGAIGLGATIP